MQRNRLNLLKNNDILCSSRVKKDPVTLSQTQMVSNTQKLPFIAIKKLHLRTFFWSSPHFQCSTSLLKFRHLFQCWNLPLMRFFHITVSSKWYTTRVFLRALHFHKSIWIVKFQLVFGFKLNQNCGYLILFFAFDLSRLAEIIKPVQIRAKDTQAVFEIVILMFFSSAGISAAGM